MRSRGVEARRRGDQAEALRMFKEAAAAGPDDPRLQNEIGAAALAVGQIKEAEDAYRSALARQPAFAEALRGLGHCARRRGDRQQALAHFQAALAVADDPRPRFEIAVERIALGADEEAAYADLLADPATHARACVDVGSALQRRGDLARARPWFENAVAADPSDRVARLGLAALCTTCWDLDRAAALYDAMLADTPDDVDALLGHGALARRRGRRAAARASFERAWRLDPRRGAVEWAREERDAGAPDRARSVLEDLRARTPGDASVHVQLGLTARAVGDTDAAIRHFADALNLDPRHLSAHVELAADLHRLGRTAEAHAMLGCGLALRPDQPRVLEALGDLAIAAEDTRAAIDLYGRAAAAAPAQLSPHCKLARGLAANGQFDEALAGLDALTPTLGLSPDVAITRAQILKEAGRLDEAADAYRSGCAAFPSNFALWLQASLFGVDRDRGRDPADQPVEGPAATPAERAKANLVRGAAMMTRWRFTEAQHWFETALDPMGRDGATHARIAQAAFCGLDLATAQRHLSQLGRLEAPTKRLRGQATGLFHSLLGQILEEARLDVEGLSHLLVAASGPEEARLDGLLATVRAFPEMTLVGMQAAITLRRHGFLDQVVYSRPAASPVPASIVQFWSDDDTPADVQVYCDTWRALNPDCAYRRYSAREAAAFIAAECEEIVGQAFARARNPASKADLFRLAFLGRRGGIYADIDDRCLAPLAALRDSGAALSLYQEDIGSIGNDFLMAAPGHPLVGRALELASRSVILGDCDIPWLSTGPGLLTRVVMQAVAQGGPAILQKEGVAIVERRDLLGLVATGCTAAYKSTRRHWSRAAFAKHVSRSDGRPPRARPAATKGGLSDERPSPD